MSAITTHVLDTSRGLPAAGVPVRLERRGEGDRWEPVGADRTDADGRAIALLGAGEGLRKGTYRLVFDTASYFAASGVEGFFPEVPVVFEVRDPARAHHVPLLLNPFGYSTYRGS